MASTSYVIGADTRATAQGYIEYLRKNIQPPQDSTLVHRVLGESGEARVVGSEYVFDAVIINLETYSVPTPYYNNTLVDVVGIITPTPYVDLLDTDVRVNGYTTLFAARAYLLRYPQRGWAMYGVAYDFASNNELRNGPYGMTQPIDSTVLPITTTDKLAWGYAHDADKLYNGKSIYIALVKNVQSAPPLYYAWYDTVAAMWYVYPTVGKSYKAVIGGGITYFTSKGLIYNSTATYNLSGIDGYLGTDAWSLWYDGTQYVISAAVGRSTDEIWTKDDPTDTVSGGIYRGDVWWSCATLTGTYAARGSQRGTTEGGYGTAATYVLTDYADYFTLAGDTFAGTCTGYGYYAGKTMYVGNKRYLTTGSEGAVWRQYYPSEYRHQTIVGDMYQYQDLYKYESGAVHMGEETTVTFKEVDTAHPSNIDTGTVVTTNTPVFI